MCRRVNYAVYKNHFACFACRKGFKRRQVHDWPDHLKPAEDELERAVCPECKQSMVNMGTDFKPPKQSDIEHWAVVEFLFKKGFAYHRGCCDGPGFRPKRRRDLALFLKSNTCKYEGQILAARFAKRNKI